MGPFLLVRKISKPKTNPREIGEAALDPKIKLEARRIANDCYRYIMDLCTNAGIVSDALKFVERKKEQLDTLQKTDKRLEESEEEKAINRSILSVHREERGIFSHISHLSNPFPIMP
jgi:hypothetical protein